MINIFLKASNNKQESHLESKHHTRNTENNHKPKPDGPPHVDRDADVIEDAATTDNVSTAGETANQKFRRSHRV